MRRKEAIAEVARRTGLPASQVRLVIEELLNVIIDEVARGNPVIFRNFGVFYPKLQRRRIARDINRGKPLVVPARFVPGFRPYPNFKRAVLEGLKEEAERAEKAE